MAVILIRHFALTAFIAFLALVFVAAAYAHLPTWGKPGEENRLDDIRVSVAYYQEIAAPDQVDIFSFSANAGEHLHAGVNIPAIDGLESYGVTMALLGPGLPPEGLADLPPGHPQAEGAIIYPSVAGEDFFEPFTQTSYWGRQTAEIDLPADGTYYILAWQPEGSTGKYVIDIGETEEFGLLAFLKLPYWWVRVHQFFRP